MTHASTGRSGAFGLSKTPVQVKLELNRPRLRKVGSNRTRFQRIGLRSGTDETLCFANCAGPACDTGYGGGLSG